jgi:hypothetical protein
MQRQLQEPNVLQREDLKSFAGATGPCVSLYFPDHDPREKTHQDVVRFRNALDQAGRRLKELGFDKGAVSELLDPVRGLAEDLGTWHHDGNAFAVFRSPDVFRVFRPMNKIDEISVVGEHFYILPVLSMLDVERHFYVLALSQKNIRLLKCTEFTSEEVTLPSEMPRGLDDFLNTRLPSESASHEQQLQPDGPLGTFTSTTDRDRRDQFIANYYRVVDTHISNVLRNETAPLVLAGVEEQVSLFAKVATYPNVSEESVSGAPDGLKGGELHARALPCARRAWEKPLARALELYEQNGGNDRRAEGVDRVVRAAYEGRVAHLFVAERARKHGVFNPDTLAVALHDEPGLNSEDLLNLAALHTLTHGGEVWLLPPDRVPGLSQIAAVLRF